MIREAVKKRSWARVDRAADGRVNLAGASENVARVSLSCRVFINQISYRGNVSRGCYASGFHMAHAEPDGVEGWKEGKRQNRANGSASDQRIGHGSPEHGMRERNKREHSEIGRAHV